MTNYDENEDITVWLNEEFALNNNMQTDEEVSDDENDNNEQGIDFLSPNIDAVVVESAKEAPMNTYEDFAIVFDDSVELGLPPMDIQEPLIISIPITALPGPSSDPITQVTTTENKNIKKLPQKNIKKKKKTLNGDDTLNSYEPNRKWSKINKTTFNPNYCLSIGPVDELFHGETATSIFLEFFDDFLDHLVFQTNLYGTQRNKTLNVKRREMLNFIGINFFMGYHKLLSWKNYWSNASDLGVQLISNTMSRNRFDIILSNLHVQDNMLIHPNNKDKLFKLNPLIEYCNEKFSVIFWHEGTFN